MKSVLLTFLMFIVLFGVLRPEVISLLDGYWFPITSVIIFIIVVGVAVFMFGLPTKQDIKNALKIKGKEAKDEKDD